MPYEPYADAEYYHNVFGGTVLPAGSESKYLRQASRHIDALTYNRIVGRGIVNLTAYQQEVIREVCCLQAEFEHNNEDMITSVLSGYSLNGASVQFGQSWNMNTSQGVAMQRDTFALLSQAGLCCRSVVVR